MTIQQADRMAELLLKIVKLQRAMKMTRKKEDIDLIYQKTDEVSAELESDFGGQKIWIDALVSFSEGQYFGQDTKFVIGDKMDIATVADCLKREVYFQNGIAWPEKEVDEDAEMHREHRSIKNPDTYAFYHARGSWPADKAHAFNLKYPNGVVAAGITMADAEKEFGIEK